ncbi:hypothetical protein [Acidovorax sp. Root275]|uniref:hypothetical protein n=1 Tax=Acidovorax sp. Root275 TaxID=1736508 RepID=UPI001124EC9B|nr:hypothetical protein [Acidovorax sp. Root275]
MKIKPVFVLCCVVAHVGAAQAAFCTFPFFDGVYRNVSAAGYASADRPLIACTMVQSDAAQNGATAVMVETVEGDAKLEVRYTDQPYPIRFADDWKQDLSPYYQDVLRVRLRSPARETDAALALTAVPGASAGMGFGMCVYGYPKTGNAWTSVSISSLGRYVVASDVCYAPPSLYFERD